MLPPFCSLQGGRSPPRKGAVITLAGPCSSLPCSHEAVAPGSESACCPWAVPAAAKGRQEGEKPLQWSRSFQQLLYASWSLLKLAVAVLLALRKGLPAFLGWG